MAGFGATVKDESEKKVKAKADKGNDIPLTTGTDLFANLRIEEAAQKPLLLSHQFVGIAAHEGAGKSGAVLYAFQNDPTRTEDDKLAAIDFDGGVAMLNSSIYKDEKIISWNPWKMGVTDRTAYNYPGTHQRVMDIMKYIITEVESGVPYWGVLVSGLDSWLEICTNNMRIVDLNLANDGIESADIRGAGDAKRVERQSDWAIRNTRFHQLTKLSRDLVRLGVRVYWETHLRASNFSYKDDGPTTWQAEWEKRSNNYLPTIIWVEGEDITDEEGVIKKTVYKAKFVKCKTNPQLVNQSRILWTTHVDGEPEWNGLPELYDGSL